MAQLWNTAGLAQVLSRDRVGEFSRARKPDPAIRAGRLRVVRRSGLFGGSTGVQGEIMGLPKGIPWSTRGARSNFGFIGTVRDANNSPVAGATVILFRTSDDAKIDKVTSGADGAYLLTTWYYPDAHYIVAFYDGTPDVQGVTVNTLIGG
jgi:hypothetical protein